MRNELGCPKALGLAFLVGAAVVCENLHASLTVQEACVELTATWAEAPNQITLHWQGDANASAYQISRKLLSDTSWNLAATVSGDKADWTDTSVSVGTIYEYQAIKQTSSGYTGYGYICTGIKGAAEEDRGKLILLVTTELADALPIELLRLEQDLVGDGWAVLRHTVATGQSLASVKDIVRADYQNDPAHVKALFMFGHVPVPFSGNFTPDGHPDDKGAWPADVFYGNFEGAWTDTTATSDNFRFDNSPGDGKFDQDRPPGPVVLQIGRVDLSNLTCFSDKPTPRYEQDLARQYLNKDHNWRHGNLAVQRRALVYQRAYVGTEPEPQNCAAFRSFPALFGSDQIQMLGDYQYFSVLSGNSYTWSYVNSGGSFYSSDYVATSDEFALNDPQVVFVSFLGSYMANWSVESDLLRAALGSSTYTLASIYSGQPQWLLHPMGMGQTLGYSAWLTQNNAPGGLYPPQVNAGAGEVHIALLGDPTLRLHPVISPRNLQVTYDGSGAQLTWTASSDTGVVGYNIYKAADSGGPFSRISGESPVTGNAFTDASGASGNHYMVRAVKLESSPSGSYYNLSQGIFYPDEVAAGFSTPNPPTRVSASKITPGIVTVEWAAGSADVRGYQIQRRSMPDGAYVTLGETSGSANFFDDSTVQPGVFGYRVKALGFTGDSDFSPEVVINLQKPGGEIAGIDRNTSGSWRSVYGTQGYMIPAAATNWPPYVSFSGSNVVLHVNSWDSSAPEAVQWPTGDSRLLSFWTGGQRESLGLNFRFTDSHVHRVAIYVVDYQAGWRSGTAQVIDPLTGNVLDSIGYSNYASGQYLLFDLKNYADVRISPISDEQAASISGIFFDVPPAVDAPQISPNSGSFLGQTTVSMSGPAGATLRYTFGGRTPDTNSTVYTSPFVLSETAVITAKAFKDGYGESLATQVWLTNTLVTSVTYVGVDEVTQGDWITKYGQDGSWIASWSSSPASYATLNLNNSAAWIWSDTTPENRAFNKYARVAGRLASTWYSSEQLIIVLSINSTELHSVALYFLDWDGGRVEDVYVADSNAKVLDHHRVDNFTQGKYLVWNAKGALHFTIQRIAGPNAVLSGIFVGSGAPISQDPPAFDSSIRIADGNYVIRINGQPGQVFDIQATSDFQTWADVSRETLSTTSAEFSIPIPTTAGAQFYRARLAQ